MTTLELTIDNVSEHINTLFSYIKNDKWIELESHLRKNKNIDTNIRDNGNNYLIQLCVLYNKITTVKLLIEHGSRLDVVDNDKRCILYNPIKYGHNDMLDLLLTYNNGSIGVSLTEIADKQEHVPLHYAVLFKNTYAIKSLLDNNAFVDKKEHMGLTALHLSTTKKYISITELLLARKANPNIVDKHGETPLHIAATLEDYNTIKLLLDHNANPNITDYENELVPIVYAVSLNRLDIIKILLKHDANINIQDQYGSTSLHHCVYEDRIEILDYLINNTSVQYNIVNIDGKSLLHLILESENINIDKKLYFLKIILPKTNVNLQDKNGVTCLLLIVKLNLWKKVISILEKKKLNIYKCSRNKECIMDYVSLNDKETFLTMVITSVYNIIVNTNKSSLSVKWHITCKSNESKCKQTIRKRILEDRISVPDIHNYKIEIYPGDIVKFGTFTGMAIDVLSGMIYLLKKWKPLGTLLTTNFIHNKQMMDYYNSLGIQSLVDNEYMNFEITWLHNKLFVPSTFVETTTKFLNESKKNKKARFFICPLGIEVNNESHANYIIYDGYTNELERFEPHGSRSLSKFNYNQNTLDLVLRQKFNEVFHNVKMITPNDYLPRIGYQLLDSSESNQYKHIGDPGGFCAIWSIWYTDMRLTYPDVPRKQLINKSIEQIRMKGYSFKSLIRNYSAKIIEVRDVILSHANVDINQWFNNNYSVEQLHKINDSFKTVISTLII